MVYNRYVMQTISAPLQLTLPPEKRKTSGVAIATTAYAFLLLASKLLWPGSHERNETLLHLLAETAFQTILFAAFFTFLRFIWPRKTGPTINVNSSLQFREDPTVECESAPQELAGTSAQSNR
jgi:hypothetical protein